MLDVLRQLVGLHRGARGVWLLRSCTCWHRARNHIFVNFVIYVLMHVLSCSMHVRMNLLSNMCLCMLYMHVCCALCTHMVLCNGSGGWRGYMVHIDDLMVQYGTMWSFDAVVWWFDDVVMLLVHIVVLFMNWNHIYAYIVWIAGMWVKNKQKMKNKVDESPLPCACTWQRGHVVLTFRPESGLGGPNGHCVMFRHMVKRLATVSETHDRLWGPPWELVHAWSARSTTDTRQTQCTRQTHCRVSRGTRQMMAPPLARGRWGSHFFVLCGPGDTWQTHRHVSVAWTHGRVPLPLLSQSCPLYHVSAHDRGSAVAKIISAV
jgi:hypothetical protein